MTSVQSIGGAIGGWAILNLYFKRVLSSVQSLKVPQDGSSVHKLPYQCNCPTVTPGSSWITTGIPVLNKHAKPGVIKYQLLFTCTNLVSLMTGEFQRHAMQIIQASGKLHLHPNNSRNSVLFLWWKIKLSSLQLLFI